MFPFTGRLRMRCILSLLSNQIMFGFHSCRDQQKYLHCLYRRLTKKKSGSRYILTKYAPISITSNTLFSILHRNLQEPYIEPITAVISWENIRNYCLVCVLYHKSDHFVELIYKLHNEHPLSSQLTLRTQTACIPFMYLTGFSAPINSMLTFR